MDPMMEEILKCSICLKTFYEPVSVSCGHSFCRGCLEDLAIQSQSLKCPLCRQMIHIFPLRDLRPNHILNQLCRMVNREEYQQRKKLKDQNDLVGIPLFILNGLCGENLFLPTRMITLYVYEWRYKEMMKRILRDTRYFILYSLEDAFEGEDDFLEKVNAGSMEVWATLVKIEEFRSLMNDKFLITGYGIDRVKIHFAEETEDLYHVANAKIVPENLENLNQKAFQSLKRRLKRYFERKKNRLEHERNHMGKVPYSDPLKFSYYICDLLNLSKFEQIRALKMKTVSERLEWLDEIFEDRMKPNWGRFITRAFVICLAIGYITLCIFFDA